jgi:hypothetical protein
MRTDHLSCAEIQSVIARGGAPTDALRDHVAQCESCFAAWTGAVFRESAHDEVPRHFSARLLAALPEVQPEPPSVLPYAIAAAWLAFAACVVALVSSGAMLEFFGALAELRERPFLLTAILGTETVAALLLLRRAASD